MTSESSAYSVASSHRGANFTVSVFEFLFSLTEKLREHTRKKAAIRELMALDDRALRDIGLSRSEIALAVDSGFFCHR
jgi:uncharacterized protein YjiS (DUF1127 family)